MIPAHDTTSAIVACPFAGVGSAPRMAGAEASAPVGIDPEERLVLPHPRRMVIQDGATGDGAPLVTLLYGDTEVAFDEPELFPFARALAGQTTFRAGDAAGWCGEPWERVRDCLEALVEGGVLERGTLPPPSPASRARPSPLPPAASATPRDWADCAAVTRDLAGRAVDPGHLELVVPVFRVAHPALDADDRQVGEANVFPRALRLDRPTEWQACTYPGNRHLADRPMNVTALKAMRAHWPEMMAALALIRRAWLARCPAAGDRLTVGEIERLATGVLAVPTYQLVTPLRAVPGGRLAPALSSLFRVTDGLRMAMHQMLFVPLGEPALPPGTPMTAERIHDYAERNHSFHSETGVCAGPRHFVAEFLAVLVEGREPVLGRGGAISPEVAAALAEMDAAFDYGLAGLAGHAAAFATWPLIARTYERLADLAAGARDPALAARLEAHRTTLRRETYLGREDWRAERDRAYADMFAGAAHGLGEAATLPGRLAAAQDAPGDLAPRIAALLPDALGAVRDDAAAALAGFALAAQAHLRVAEAAQGALCDRLGRARARRPLDLRDLDVHARLQGAEGPRLPFILDELGQALGLDLGIDSHRIALGRTSAPTRGLPRSTGSRPAMTARSSAPEERRA